MAKRAVFYADLGPAAGLGHVVRCSALADALRIEGWTCAALTPSPPPAFVSASFDTPPAGDAELLVVDHYRPDPALVERWRKRGARLLQIHDGGDTPVLGELLLNPNADAPGGSAELAGPAYALVRRAFPERRADARAASERSRAGRVLVAPGATDVAGLCRRLAARRDRRYTFVLSRLAPDFAEVARLVEHSGGAHTLLADADAGTLAELMLAHDLAIGNGGGGSWERCTLGLPSVSVVMAENQRGNARALAARGATLLATGIAEIEQCMASADLRRLSEESFATTDGLGAYRAVLALAPEAVALRPAAAGDCERVYRWQQDPATRRYARNPAVPGLQEHNDWFAAKLRDHRCIFSLVLHEGREAGVVRLDHREQRQGKPCYEVSIFVDPALHGRGIGAAALRAARRLTPFAWRRAFVDGRNAASVALFARAGYGSDGAFLYDPPTC